MGCHSFYESPEFGWFHFLLVDDYRCGAVCHVEGGLQVVFEIGLVDGESGCEQTNVVTVDGIFLLLFQGESLAVICSCNLYVSGVSGIGERQVLVVVARQIDGVGYRVGIHDVSFVSVEVLSDKERQIIVKGMVGEDCAEFLFQSVGDVLLLGGVEVNVYEGMNLCMEYQIILDLIVFATLAHVFIDA